VLGQKDYQQLLVVRRMTEDLNLPIEVVMAPTRRDDDGLALSSRNQLLDEAERRKASGLYEVIKTVAERLQSGQRDFAALESDAREMLSKKGFEPDYVSIRRAENLDMPDRDSDELVVLAAASLGETRLVDNMLVHV